MSISATTRNTKMCKTCLGNIKSLHKSLPCFLPMMIIVIKVNIYSEESLLGKVRFKCEVICDTWILLILWSRKRYLKMCMKLAKLWNWFSFFFFLHLNWECVGNQPWVTFTFIHEPGINGESYIKEDSSNKFLQWAMSHGKSTSAVLLDPRSHLFN